jgi:hypothetical protein
MSYDTKCGELARHFLQDDHNQLDEAKVATLAQEIQDAVELFLSFDELAPNTTQYVHNTGRIAGITDRVSGPIAK